MPERHFYRFPSVDFFGKSMPGVAFTLLSIPLIPETLFNEIFGNIEELSLALVVIGIFVIIVVGFTIGQGLNTVSIIVEMSLYKTGIIISKAFLSEEEFLDDYNWFGEYSEEDVSFVRWTGKRFENIKRIFVPHRILFKDWIRRHLAKDRPGHFHDKIEIFREKYESYSGKTGQAAPQFPESGENPGDIFVPNDIYLLISDYLTHEGVNRARRHKSLFVFCRNSATTFMFFALIYALVLIDVAYEWVVLLNEKNDTVLAHLFAGDTIDPSYPIILVLFSTSVIFMYATGLYKKYHIEYLIVDFINNRTEHEQNSNSQPDQHN